MTRTQSRSGSGALGRTGVTSDFAQRASGVTAGTTSRGGQPVFASSAPAKAKSASSRERAAASTPSARSAAGDLWTGFKPGERASVLQASAAPQSDGISGTAAAALAVLGLGLTGIAGATSFVALRSRRARSRPTAGGSGTTEM